MWVSIYHWHSWSDQGNLEYLIEKDTKKSLKSSASCKFNQHKELSSIQKLQDPSMSYQDHSSYIPTPPTSHLKVSSNQSQFDIFAPITTPTNMHSSLLVIQEPQNTPTNTPIWNNISSSFIPTPPQVSPQQSVTGLRPNTIFKGIFTEPTPIKDAQTMSDEEEDDATIESNLSTDPKIEPCSDFSKYSYWLKKHFPSLMTKTNMNFIENVLEIKDYNTALKFHYFQPKDWSLFLGKYLFQRYLKVIAHLTVIWDVTLGRIFPVPYAMYCDAKDKQFEEILTNLISMLENSPGQSVNPPVSSNRAPKPPPYTKVSPAVKRYQESKLKTPSYHSRRHSSKSSRQTYRTTAPNPIGSNVSVPVVEAYAAEEELSLIFRVLRSQHKKQRCLQRRG